MAGTALNYVTQGLHWFRRGFGRVAGHVEVLSPRKTAEKKLTANDERFALAA